MIHVIETYFEKRKDVFWLKEVVLFKRFLIFQTQLFVNTCSINTLGVVLAHRFVDDITSLKTVPLNCCYVCKICMAYVLCSPMGKFLYFVTE